MEELQAAVNVAKATIEKAKADVVETQFAYQADLTLQKQGQGAVSTLDVEKDKANKLRRTGEPPTSKCRR